MESRTPEEIALSRTLWGSRRTKPQPAVEGSATKPTRANRKANSRRRKKTEDKSKKGNR